MRRKTEETCLCLCMLCVMYAFAFTVCEHACEGAAVGVRMPVRGIKTRKSINNV